MGVGFGVGATLTLRSPRAERWSRSGSSFVGALELNISYRKIVATIHVRADSFGALGICSRAADKTASSACAGRGLSRPRCRTPAVIRRDRVAPIVITDADEMVGRAHHADYSAFAFRFARGDAYLAKAASPTLSGATFNPFSPQCDPRGGA